MYHPSSFARDIVDLVDSFPTWMEEALKDLPQVLRQTKMKGTYALWSELKVKLCNNNNTKVGAVM